jgi:hypothetical protein
MIILESKPRYSVLLFAFTSVAICVSAQTSRAQQPGGSQGKSYQRQQSKEEAVLESWSGPLSELSSGRASGLSSGGQQASQSPSEPPIRSSAEPESGPTQPPQDPRKPDQSERRPDSAKDQNQDKDKDKDKEKDKDKDPQNSGATSASGNNAQGKQTKRILWIFPNYRSVSANTQLPILSLKQKFWLATQDSFDYSSVILAAAVAGLGQAQKQYPEFKQGAAGYGRYFWHAFVDQAVGDYFTEAIVPALTREDPRYYTLGHGGFFRRAGYALSRLVVTRTDNGGRAFNFSEIIGNGAGAGISNLYYPSQERTFGKTGSKWATQVGLDGLFNLLKEFWPDINQALFHGKY